MTLKNKTVLKLALPFRKRNTFHTWIRCAFLSSYKKPTDQRRTEKHFQNLWRTQLAINATVLLVRCIPRIFFQTATIYGTWIGQPLWHSTTLLMRTLYPSSILKQKLTNLEQAFVRCSLHCDRWTVKGNKCASVLLFFIFTTYRTDDWTKQFLRLKRWVIFGSIEQTMEFHCFWRAVIVFNYSCLV